MSRTAGFGDRLGRFAGAAVVWILGGALVLSVCGDDGPSPEQRELFAEIKAAAHVACVRAESAQEMVDSGPAARDEAQQTLDGTSAALDALWDPFHDAGLQAFAPDYPLAGTRHGMDLVHDGLVTGEVLLFAEGSALLAEGCRQLRHTQLD